MPTPTQTTTTMSSGQVVLRCSVDDPRSSPFYKLQRTQQDCAWKYSGLFFIDRQQDDTGDWESLAHTRANGTPPIERPDGRCTADQEAVVCSATGRREGTGTFDRGAMTMKKATTLAALALCASLWLTLAVVPASAVPAHLRWAEEIALNVTPDLNAYAGDYPSDPPYIHWLGVQNANKYENYTKCASFVTRVLQQAYGWDKNYFYQWLGHESPFATHYHQAIKDGTGFLVIQKITDIQSGDIIAIDYPDDAKDTGHVMIAAGAPTLTLGGATALMYTIEVIDSTKDPPWLHRHPLLGPRVS